MHLQIKSIFASRHIVMATHVERNCFEYLYGARFLWLIFYAILSNRLQFFIRFPKCFKSIARAYFALRPMLLRRAVSTYVSFGDWCNFGPIVLLTRALGLSLLNLSSQFNFLLRVAIATNNNNKPRKSTIGKSSLKHWHTYLTDPWFRDNSFFSAKCLWILRIIYKSSSLVLWNFCLENS